MYLQSMRYVMGVVTRAYVRDDLYPICNIIVAVGLHCMAMHVGLHRH